MADELRSVGAQISDAIYPGGHDWQLWNEHLLQMLILAWKDVTHPLSPRAHHEHHRTHRRAHHHHRPRHAPKRKQR
jgi:hypothetical protein